MTSYDFGYHWGITYGHLIPFAAAAGVAALAVRLGWRRWIVVLSSTVAGWALIALGLTHLIGINRPMTVPTDRFLASGEGRVLDAGAGSGRAAIGILLARPRVTAIGLDIYQGYWGIDGNTPERFMQNARVAGVADRAEARVGDMRELPFGDAEFDAVVSSYAVDHLRQDGIVKALNEFARVLKPGGEVLLLIVNTDWVTWIASPHAIAHHPRQDPLRWRARLEEAGFVVEELGTKPATLYVLARKRR